MLFAEVQDGNYFMQNFSYSDYKGNNQVLGAIQDDRGIIYFANSDVGILEYDGISWRQTSLSNSSSGRCLAKAKDGTIYVGGVGDFGYISVENGISNFNSLVDKIPNNKDKFEYVWECEANADGIYFNTDNILYHYDGDKITPIYSEDGFHILRESQGRLFVRIIGKGLYEVIKNKLHFLKGSEKFKESSADSIIVKDDNTIVIFSRDAGLFEYKNNKLISKELKNGEALLKALIYDAVVIDNGRYAVATKNGMFIVDVDGQVKQHINMYLGLVNNIVLHIFPDKEGNLWISTDGGISKVNISNGLSFYDDRQGVNSSVNDIKIFNNDTYIATMNGVLKKENLIFKKLLGLNNEVWKLEVFDNTLYIASTAGFFKLDKDEIVASPLTKESVVSSSVDEKNKLLFISQANEILIVKNISKKLQIVNKIENLADRPLSMIHHKNDLWFTNEKKGLYKISFKNGVKDYTITNYSNFLKNKNKKNFLIKKINNKLYFLIDNIFYHFNEKTKKFIASNPISLAKDVKVKDIVTINDTIFVVSGNDLITSEIINKGDKTSLQRYPFVYFNGKKIMVAEETKNNSFWLGSPDGLISYSPIKDRKKSKSSIIIRDLYLDEKGSKFSVDVIFTYLTLSEFNQYSFILNGPYSSTQNYSNDNHFNVTNLPHGDYTLAVKAKNIFDEENVKEIKFTILTPWYYSNIAYGVYVVLFLLILYIYGKIQGYYQAKKQQAILDEQIRRRKILEEKVTERTKELAQKTDQVTILLNNADQGFLSFSKDLIIQDGYSKECFNIFSKEIEGEVISDLLFEEQNNKKDFFETTIKSLFDNENPMNVETIISLFVKEIIIDKQYIFIEYKRISDVKFMLILTNITETKQLEKTLDQEKHILKMVVSSVSDENELSELLALYRNFIENVNENINFEEEPSVNLSYLYREVHTFKGLFLQKDFISTPKGLHILENKLSEFKEEENLQNQQLSDLIARVKFSTWLQKDMDILNKELGDSFLSKKDRLSIDKKDLNQLAKSMNKLIKLSDSSKINAEVIHSFKKLKYQNLLDQLSSYDKVVQNTSAQLEKNISLSINGDRTILTSTNWRAFINSLVHVFRNSVDHGIEDAETRMIQEKSEIANIFCKVFREDKNIIIEIMDDGAGIDVENIKNKAIQKGLYTDDEISKMQDETILNLIFNDYFSTSDEITTLSGRGVGLSAVQNEIKLLGGDIKIDTKIGEGTKFTFIIPKGKYAI
ncbi:MAG: ATP-binding protein [Campylobacterota bacterium]|nr:ATP-binding protein [Campylobacterota bacterium]